MHVRAGLILKMQYDFSPKINDDLDDQARVHWPIVAGDGLVILVLVGWLIVAPGEWF